MFYKYPKTFRILLPEIDIKGKHFLSKADVKKLLGGKVTILEKMDGANVGIIRTKNEFRLQKRGSLVGASTHNQFNYFKAWSYNNYDKLMAIPKNTILFGELCYAVHTITYDKLPDYFLAFAWLDRVSNTYYHWTDLVELCDKIGLSTVPHIYSGYTNKMDLFNMMPDPSHYSTHKSEGLIVWNYRQNMRGKIVREEFQKSMDDEGHWRTKPITVNELAK